MYMGGKSGSESTPYVSVMQSPLATRSKFPLKRHKKRHFKKIFFFQCKIDALTVVPSGVIEASKGSFHNVKL